MLAGAFSLGELGSLWAQAVAVGMLSACMVIDFSHFLAPSFYRNSRVLLFLKEMSSVAPKNSRPSYCLRFSRLGVGCEELL
jgi:hypothetical protein